MNRAFIFPGQGSQVIGMGKDFYDNYPESKEIFDKVDEVLGYKLSKIIFEGPDDKLTLTQHTQPALMTVSMAILAIITKNKNLQDLCSYVAGHSLGEYTALCAAKSLSLKDTALLLQTRGESMQEAAPIGSGSMAACLGIGITELETLIARVKEGETCQIANDNISGQIVISGNAKAVDRVIAEMQLQGFRAIKLNVSAPFHSELIKSAEIIMANALEKVVINKPVVPLIANVNASKTTDPIEIKQNLIEQICGRVRWRESLDRLQALSIKEVVEIGSGRVLTNMIKKASYPFMTRNISNTSELKEFLQNT